MSFQIIKSDSYCVGGRHGSATSNVYGDITSKGSKILVGQCSLCSGKKSLTVTNNTITAEGLRDFSKSLGRKRTERIKNYGKNGVRSPGRAPEIGANVGTAFASRSRKVALSSQPDFD